MSGVNRRFLLRERPAGRIDDRTFELVEEPVPVIGEGEALVRTRWISLDPANRAWLNETPTYLPPVAIGDVMRASGVGEVVAAAGAVGSVAGQLAKIQGARVVGIAGGPEKCALLLDALGFDAAVDYKAPDWRDRLKAATPDGIDVDFENVGGEVMEAVYARLNVRARVPLCGLISTYNDDAAAVSPGPGNFGNLLIQRVHLEGFIVLDHLDRAPQVIAQLAEWMAEGKLTANETVVEGFEQLPVAINMLFDGQNTGKLVVKL